MSATFEDSLLDFDINFLQPPANATESRSDKNRRHVLMVKRKIISIDSLLKKYYAQRDKWEQGEVTLLTAKEECKQACINYQDALEKCTLLEKDLDLLNKQNVELGSKCTLSQNQYEGMKSHANQLELLVKEHESVIEALKIEKHLEKNNSEDYENHLSSIQKEKKALLKHLSLFKDIALGKKKLRERHKVLLQNYDLKDVSSEDDSSSDDSCDRPDFFDDSPHSPLFTSPEDCAGVKKEQNILKPNEMKINIKKDSAQFNEDSNCSNEVVSEDTGRGSSLAFSDGEKCFNSPDYFSNDSPENIATKICKSNEKYILVDTRTSPNKSQEVAHVATSPLIFDDEALLSDNNTLFRNETNVNSPEYFINEIPLSNEIVTIKEKRKLIDIGTSPIKDIEKVNIATSPVVFEECVDLDEMNGLSTSPVTDYHASDVIVPCDIISRQPPFIVIDDTATGVNRNHTAIDTLAKHCELEISGKSIEERKCLERNNSKNFCDENSSDSEIDMILNTMRLTQRLITPIPKTPVKAHNNETRKVQEFVQKISESSGEHRVCLDSITLREDNKILHKDIGDLKKDIMYIKCLLKNHLLNNAKSKVKISKENDISVNPEIYDDTSQKSIIIDPIDDNSNNGNEAITNLNLSNSFTNKLSTVIEEESSGSTGGISEHSTSFNASNSQNVSQTNESPIIVDTHLEKEFRSNVNKIEHVYAKNDSREAITYEEDLRNEDESDIIINIDVDHNIKDSSEDCCINKRRKNKKLSKLDRFKKTLLPKSKISKVDLIRKLRSKSRLVPIIEITRMDPTTILNNKSAYENAAKVMAEIKSKEKHLANKTSIAREPKKMVGGKNDSMDSDCLEQQQVTCDIEEGNPERHIRRNSNDEHDLNDKPLESIEYIDPQIEHLPITTRSRCRKLNNNSSYVSPTQSDIIGNDSSKSEEDRSILKRGSTDSPIVKNKRVLRSSINRNVFTDSDNVKKAVLNDYSQIISDVHDKKRKRKLSDCMNEEQNINDIYENDSSAPNKKLKLKLFNSKDEEQSISENVNSVSESPNKPQDRELSKTENEIQNITYNVNNVSNVLNRIQDPKLPLSENEKQKSNDVKNVSLTLNNIQDRILSNVDRKEQEHTKNSEKSDSDLKITHPKQSILCKMLEKYGRVEPKSSNKKVLDNTSNSICKKLEEEIAAINELPACKVKSALNKLVDEVQSWNMKHFLLGLMTYLNDPDRKRELFNKVNSPPAPAMTKSEQVVLYVVSRLETQTPNIVYKILTYIEFSLFQLNRTPEFDVIESLSHIYALLCRYFGLKSRLRQFLLDAMYCLQFKVVPLIKQCLDVWMHILPLAHMGIAKSPLVTCLVYLLHFYKCEDRFNRVKEIRNILSQKYFYKFTDWNEQKILEMFKNAIKEVRDIPVERKMLRMALILLGKRHGAKWCLKNIIKNMLLPMIEGEDTPMKTKQFCVQMLGALLKPFPADMKLHLEIVVSQLHDMLQQNPSDAMKEAIFTSLIYINHHNQSRLQRALLSWKPKEISPEFQERFQDYVRGIPLHVWKKFLSRMTM